MTDPIVRCAMCGYRWGLAAYVAHQGQCGTLRWHDTHLEAGLPEDLLHTLIRWHASGHGPRTGWQTGTRGGGR